MTGGCPTGRSVSNRLRLEISLAGLLLLLLVPATGQAAQVTLFDPLSQNLPVVESDPPLVEMVDETLEPATDVVVDTVVQIDEFVGPFVEPPPVDRPEVVDSPLSEVVGGDLYSLESNDSAVEAPAFGLNSNVTIEATGDTAVVVQGAKQKEFNNFEQSLLTTDPSGSFTTINRNSSPVDTGFLSRLKSWLPPILAGLVDVLAAPVKLLWFLLRALVSSGKWLISPASLLVALMFMMVVDRNAPSLSSMRRELAESAPPGGLISHNH